MYAYHSCIPICHLHSFIIYLCRKIALALVFIVLYSTLNKIVSYLFLSYRKLYHGFFIILSFNQLLWICDIILLFGKYLYSVNVVSIVNISSHACSFSYMNWESCACQSLTSSLKYNACKIVCVGFTRPSSCLSGISWSTSSVMSRSPFASASNWK